MCVHHAFKIAICLSAAYSATAGGQPRIVFEGGLAPVDEGNQILILPDTPTVITISVANDGPNEFGGGGLVLLIFEEVLSALSSGVSLDSWEWIFPNVDNADEFFSRGLPNPHAGSFGRIPIEVPPGGHTGVVTLTVCAESDTFSAGDAFELVLMESHSPVGDANFVLVDIADGSERATFVIAETPTNTVAVLAPCGILTLAVGVALWRSKRRF